jgi:hypothetical protein
LEILNIHAVISLVMLVTMLITKSVKLLFNNIRLDSIGSFSILNLHNNKDMINYIIITKIKKI